MSTSVTYTSSFPIDVDTSHRPANKVGNIHNGNGSVEDTRDECLRPVSVRKFVRYG